MESLGLLRLGYANLPYTALLFLEDRVMEDMAGMVNLTRFVVGSGTKLGSD